MLSDDKLNVLQIAEYNLICNKNPRGAYDKNTRENLNTIIEKLRNARSRHSRLEARLFEKFQYAQFDPLQEKDKRVKMEVARYRLSSNVKSAVKFAFAGLAAVAALGAFSYHFVLSSETRRDVDMAFYNNLNQVGLVSKERLEEIQASLQEAAQELQQASARLEETQQHNMELSQVVEDMILNNQVTENLKYIVKQVYGDPRARYVSTSDRTSLQFDGREIASYLNDPKLWYLLGVVETGALRIYYDNEEILEIRAIFGRKGEETPLGEYAIKNKVYKPTWYKKELKDGRTRVRAIPFGDEDHEIGHWWLGLKKMSDQGPGSYGIHGVNVNRVNEFYKKNFDWRNGSAGCPNIQEWYLHFLAKMVPLGTHVNIVKKDKWRDETPAQSSAA
ncbi:MAG: L,D-transpeptidase [Candidatus Nitrohelix vancouverensis]|uniref:L,D-transpeptidase n=1 Tax=Candidatus Nitrohelix vancouverensis TaxID=2705534 RepID=A0A7T0C0Z5_9BACT|nr:MAG: L,D-transpeptidase [Candidatus Nitrohelix vancouverensis]